MATTETAQAIAADAFVYGYPLVLMDLSREAFLTAGRPNAFTHAREFPDASFTAVVSPNADTLYSTAWLDLAAEPVVLSVPPSEGRYYLLPMLSGWTDVFASPGTRTTGAGAGAFAVTGPGWQGRLPPEVQELRAPTAMVFVIGRTQTNGKADYAAVHRFQSGLSLTPLSTWGAGAPSAASERAIEGGTPPPDLLAAMDADTFFTRLATLLVANPPADADAPALERFAAIGLTPGAFEPRADLDAGVRAGLDAIRARLLVPDEPANGWSLTRGLGRYGTDYLKRAFIALMGLGANLAEDSVYPHTAVDRDGRPLHGANRYRLHFEPGQTPPARAFWSLTMYDDRHYFVANPLDRYALGDRDALAFNGDGSLDVWLGHERPGPEREPNWLPAPAGAFNLILRIYWPQQEVVDGSWLPPGVELIA